MTATPGLRLASLVASVAVTSALLSSCRPSLEQSLTNAQRRWQHATCIEYMPPVAIRWTDENYCGAVDAWGCWTPGDIWINSRIDERNQAKVVMHEYGHELAQLPHLHVTGNSIMFPSINGMTSYITPDDIAFVCINSLCRCNHPEKP